MNHGTESSLFPRAFRAILASKSGINQWKGVFSIPRNLPKENGLEVGDQTLFISRVTFKGRLLPRLLKAGGSRPPSPSERSRDKSVDEICTDESRERPVPDPLDVLLDAMLILRPDAEVAIASDNDVHSLCRKALWTFEYEEWTIQKAMELLQSCADCMEKEDQVLTLNFPIESPRGEELLDENSEQDTKQIIDTAMHSSGPSTFPDTQQGPDSPWLTPTVRHNVGGYTSFDTRGRSQLVEERLRQLSEIIGYPIERQNDHLWITAITHRSYSEAERSNGGLARLGDLAKLDELAYYRHMPTLPPRLCADLVQAIIGAVYLDCVAHNCNPMEMVEAVMDNLDLLFDPSRSHQEQDAATTSDQGYDKPSSNQIGSIEVFYKPSSDYKYH
ncbi:hypothetical protein BT69DRAFT_681697 [Atractiella rhizophila]|nr:hypothetical protein BT69DRAFT_681697 [Atractiella rhizophila]